MIRSILIVIALPLLAATVAGAAAPSWTQKQKQIALGALPDVADIQKAMMLANDYFINATTTQNCGWTRGTWLRGTVAQYDVTKDEKYLKAALDMCNYYNWTSCAVGSKDELNANNQNIDSSYVRLHMMDQSDPTRSIQSAIDTLAIQVNRTVVDDWSWIDAIFMAMPSFAAVGNVTGDTRYYDKLFELYMATAHDTFGLWDHEVNLFYRDVTYFNKTSPNGEAVMWARGNGWAVAAMALTLEFLPADRTEAWEYTEKLQLMAEALLPLQGEDGLWRSDLLDPEHYPNPESSGTGLFTTGLAYGVRTGKLDSKFIAVVAKAWEGMSSISLQPNGFYGYCQPPGASPKPATVSDTEDYCLGAFLMAGSEIIKLIQMLQS